MSENFGIGNKFDVAWQQAQQQLISQGNQNPTTQDILHYLVDKWKSNKEQGEQLLVQGFHLEHDQSPAVPKYGVNIGCSQDTAPVMKYGANIGYMPQDTAPVMKYGANIGYMPQDTAPVMKYGANIGCMPQDTAPVMKYGANIGCMPQDTAPVMKYGANIGCMPQNTAPVMKYGANIGCMPQDTAPVMKYGANIGCSNLKVNLKNRKFINTLRANMKRVHPTYQVDTLNRTIKVIKKEINEQNK